MSKDVLYIFGGAAGDTLLGVQLFHALKKADEKATLTFISTRKSGFSQNIVASVPGARYEELPLWSVRSWLRLVSLAARPHSVVFLEPFQDKVSLRWRCIARIATLMPGSKEVRCQSRPASAPGRVGIVRYNPKTDNLFEVMTRIPAALGYPAVDPFVPYLPQPTCAQSARSYILFHFFAGSYRRSFPIEKVRPLLTAARKEFPNDEFVLTCAHGEELDAAQMIEGIANARVVVSPKITELYCLITNSRVVVGVASGVTHIAAHLNTRAVVLCNLSDPCWLPTYNTTIALLSAREQCLCNGDKTGNCWVTTPRGSVYRCLYYIPTEDTIRAMHEQIHP